MELEQVVKRLEWLDEERRKDKLVISTLEKRLADMEGNIPSLQQQIKDLSGEVTRISVLLTRLDTFDSALAQLRVEANRNIDTIEKQRNDQNRETEKLRRVEVEGLNKSIAEIRKGLDPIPEIRKTLQARIDEEFRLGRLIEEVEQKVIESRRFDEEYKRSQKLMEEGLRQDNKRLTDLVGEMAAIRKRTEDQRGRIDLALDNVRKMENRISDLVATESERRQSQTTFLEKNALIQVERDRVWKEWQNRFEAIEKQAVNLDSQIQTLDTTHRSVKKSQELLDDVIQRIERRINEITEMQRLSEDRFRQDWNTFKADDQKRWTNYTLTEEEQQRDVNRQFEKMNERILFFDDSLQEIKEGFHQIIEENERRLSSLLVMAHDWMSNYEKVFGRTR